MQTLTALLPSRTIWTNLIIMALCFGIPGAESFIRAHPVGSIAAVNALNIFLRYLTHRSYLNAEHSS